MTCGSASALLRPYKPAGFDHSSRAKGRSPRSKSSTVSMSLRLLPSDQQGGHRRGDLDKLPVRRCRFFFVIAVAFCCNIGSCAAHISRVSLRGATD